MQPAELGRDSFKLVYNQTDSLKNTISKMNNCKFFRKVIEKEKTTKERFFSQGEVSRKNYASIAQTMVWQIFHNLLKSKSVQHFYCIVPYGFSQEPITPDSVDSAEGVS